MAKIKIQKFIFSLAILGTVVLVPSFAFAQVVSVNGTTPELPTYVANTGVPGSSLIIAAINNGPGFANKTCAALEQTFFTADNAATVGFGGLSLIGGGTDLATKLNAKLLYIDNTLIPCRQAVLTSLSAITTPDTNTAQIKLSLYNSVSASINSLKAKEEPLKNQIVIAEQSIWKTIVYNILIKTTQSVSTNMLSKLVSNYAIKDFVGYASALATQVYDNQLIQSNYSGNNANQMLIRSMINNPITQSQLSPTVVQMTNAALGFNPLTTPLSPSDPNFYVKLGMMGSVQANPYYQQVSMANQAQALHNQSLATAQVQIAQSNGLKTPMNCPGVVAQQTSIDQSYQAANDQLNNRFALYTSLQQAQQLGQNVSASDLAKAKADWVAATNQVASLPNTVQSGAITICKDIVSPPTLINQGINEALHSIGQNLGAYNNNNLPFFVNFITSVATQYTNSLIFGGNAGASTHVLTNALTNPTAIAGLAATAVAAEFQAQQNNGMSFTVQRTDGGANPGSASYNLTWDASGVSNATGIILSGQNLSSSISNVMQPGNLTSSVNVTVNYPGTYTYTIIAYGKSRADVQATAKLIVTPTAVTAPTQVASNVSTPSPTASNVNASCQAGGYSTVQACLAGNNNSQATCNAICGTVAGAEAARPLFEIRGPEGIEPRGVE